MLYIIQKFISNGYCNGYITIMEQKDKPKTFISEQAAFNWLMENDKDFSNLPLKEVAKIYTIKPYKA